MLYLIFIFIVMLCILFNIPIFFIPTGNSGGELIFTHIILIFILLLLIRIYELLKQYVKGKNEKD